METHVLHEQLPMKQANGSHRKVQMGFSTRAKLPGRIRVLSGLVFTASWKSLRLLAFGMPHRRILDNACTAPGTYLMVDYYQSRH